MKKWMQVIFCTALILITGMAMQKSAWAKNLPVVQAPVRMHLTGTLPSKAEDFTITIKAEKEDSPMPEGSLDGVYRMHLSGETTARIPDLVYDRTGTYTYTIFQEAGSNPNCTYDDHIYHLTVWVKEGENGEEMEAAAALRRDDLDEKQAEAEFSNHYQTIEKPSQTPIPSPTPIPSRPSTNVVKTGDENRLLFYKLLFMVSGMGVVCVLYKKRKVNG